MKFRLPFQIYRTGVISRSNSPRKIINKFSKDNEAKVRKKSSKINFSYRAIISNYIYRFTHLPLKRTMSKLRNRAIFRSSMKSHSSKIRNEFVFLHQASSDNSSRRKPRSDKVTSGASECYMNSTKCANFMCAKSTARILLKQKDILCNKNSNKSVAVNPEEVKQSKENKNPKNEITKTPTAQPSAVKDNQIINNTMVTPPVKKIEKTVETPSKEKHKPNEYKWKFNKSENVASNSELRRLKRLLHNSDRNRNYKIEEAPPAPIRMDNVMGVQHFPKKLPELPIQIMPKIEQVRPKDSPTLVAPKRKYEAPEMTRNYKITEDVSHGPPRMDNLVGKEAKRLHESFSKQAVTIKNNQVTEGKIDAGSNKTTKHFNLQASSNNNKVNEEKDAFLLKLDQVVNDLMPKTKIPTRSLQQLNSAKINVSERIRKYEELIKNNYDKHRSKSEGSKSRLSEKKLTQGQQLEKKEHGGILTPKLSPFAIAEIRRKYYPPDTFEKQPLRITPQMTFEVPVIERNDRAADTKMKHFYPQPKDQYKNLDENLFDIKPTATSNLSYNATPTKRKMSSNIRKSEIISDASRAKMQSRIEMTTANIPQDIETLKQDRKFSTDVLTRNIDDRNSREIDRNIMMNPNSNLHRLSQRNLSKRHCTIKVTSTLDNQDNTASSNGASDKLTRKLSYQYYHEQCTISKNLNNYEMASINLPPTPINEQKAETIEINANDLMTEEGYNKMLNEKTTLINDYIKWKMQLQKFGAPPKKSSEPSKYCLNLSNKINKQNKYKLRKFKIIRRKQKVPSTNNIQINQDQNEAINNTVDLIKTQVAQNCVLFDKISDALLKKTDIINYCNHANNEVQQQNEEKMEYLQDNKKRKLSVVPMLDSPPKRKYVPVAETKKCCPSSETAMETNTVPPLEITKPKSSPPHRETTKNVSPSREMKSSSPCLETKSFSPSRETKSCVPLLETKHVVEPMEIDMPQTNSVTNSADEETNNKRRSCSRKSSFKLKGPRVPSREASRLELKCTNKSNFLEHSVKIKPHSIPATMKAKKFLAKIEAGPDQAGHLLIKKIDKKIKGPKSKTKLLCCSDKIGKYIS